jgi:hypothetical protein
VGGAGVTDLGRPVSLTGLPCQAIGTTFIAAIPHSIAFAICVWHSSGIVHTSCL